LISFSVVFVSYVGLIVSILLLFQKLHVYMLDLKHELLKLRIDLRTHAFIGSIELTEKLYSDGDSDSKENEN